VLLGRKKCLFGGCALGALLTHVNHQVRVFMASRNLTDLMGASLKHTLYLAGLGGKDAGAEKPKRARTQRPRTAFAPGVRCPGRVPKPSREAPRPAKLGGSQRIPSFRHP
jgi:hypothetical protein